MYVDIVISNVFNLNRHFFFLYYLLTKFIISLLSVVGKLFTWILGVSSKQLRLLHGRVGDSTIVVNSLSPQMSDLVEDAIAS